MKTHRIAVRAIALAAVTTTLSGAAMAQLQASNASATHSVAVAARDASFALSLEEAVILALEHNELVNIAEEGERRAQAVKREAGAGQRSSTTNFFAKRMVTGPLTCYTWLAG